MSRDGASLNDGSRHARGFAQDQFWLDLNDVRPFLFRRDTSNQGLGSEAAHFHQRLPDGGEGRDVERGTVNVIEADNGNIGRHMQTRILHRANGADCRNIVERKQSRKRNARSENFLGSSVTQLGRGRDPSNCAVRLGSTSIASRLQTLRIDCQRTAVSELKDCPFRNAILRWPKW